MLTRRLAVLALVAAAFVTLAAADVTRTLKIQLPASQAFAVENLAGSFRIIPGDGDSVVATATVHAESDELADAVRFELASDAASRATYRVKYPYGSLKTFRYPGPTEKNETATSWLSSMLGGSNTNTTYDGHSVKVSTTSGKLLYADVEVTVPRRGVDGKFSNVVGRLDARGLEGELRFATGSGEVTLEGISGTVNVDAGSGDIQANGLKGTLKAQSGSGDVNIQDFDGDSIRCDVGSGDVRLKSVTAPKIVATTGSGDIEAAGVAAETFDAGTGSGDVLLRGTGPHLAKVSADTGSGDVTLQLGADASFEVTASQGSGDIVNRYSDAQPIVKGREVIGYRRGGGQTKIRVETGSGDLVVEPGSGHAAI